MKRKLFLSILIVFFTISIVGCNNQTPTKEQPKEQISVSKKQLEDDYMSKERCGKRSEEWVKSKYGDSKYSYPVLGIGIMTFEYENHYNKKLNKCFVVVTKKTLFTDNSGSSDEQELYDVNENKQYGFVTYIHSKNKPQETICSFLGENCDVKGGWYVYMTPYMEE